MSDVIDAPLVSAPSLVIASVEIVEDSVNRAPSGKPLDLLELDLVVKGLPEGLHLRFRDKVRIECERDQADKVIAALGIPRAV